MTPEQSTALVAALVTMAVAIMSYLSVQLNQARSQRTAQHAATMAALQQVAAAPPARAAPAGGGATPRAYPIWNQLNDPLPDGSQPAQRYTECGEECAAEVIYQQHGVPVAADALRALLRGPGGLALTSGADLVKLLGLCGVQATIATPSADKLAASLQAISAEKRAAIVLGTWITPGVLHWILILSADLGACQYNDPWGGFHRVAPWADMRTKYAGTLVEITRAPDLGH